MPDSYMVRVAVPDLIGKTVTLALATADSHGFALGVVQVSSRAIDDAVDVTPLMVDWIGHHVVSLQNPIAGTMALCGLRILVHVEWHRGGGEAGDREPRVSGPPVTAASQEASLSTDDVRPSVMS